MANFDIGEICKEDIYSIATNGLRAKKEHIQGKTGDEAVNRNIRIGFVAAIRINVNVNKTISAKRIAISDAADINARTRRTNQVLVIIRTAVYIPTGNNNTI